MFEQLLRCSNHDRGYYLIFSHTHICQYLIYGIAIGGECEHELPEVEGLFPFEVINMGINVQNSCSNLSKKLGA